MMVVACSVLMVARVLVLETEMGTFGWVSVLLLNLVLRTKSCGGLLGSSGIWWRVLAAGLGLDEDLCGDLGDVDVLGGNLDFDVDGGLVVGEDGSPDEGAVGLGEPWS